MMEYTNYKKDIVYSIQKIRHIRPLVLNITNYVSMNFVANALLAFGASPLMGLEKQELQELVEMSDSVVINMGTLDEQFLGCAKAVAEYAKIYQKPVVFEPIGCGVSQFRHYAAEIILETGAISVVRGNASEIIALSGLSAFSKGVDSVHFTEEATVAATKIVKKYGVTVLVSGDKDMIVNSSLFGHIDLDIEAMNYVSGMGGVAAAICGAFLGCEKDVFFSAFAAALVMASTGREANKNAIGPGSFAVNFIDQLSLINTEQIICMTRSYIEAI